MRASHEAISITGGNGGKGGSSFLVRKGEQEPKPSTEIIELFRREAALRLNCTVEHRN